MGDIRQAGLALLSAGDLCVIVLRDGAGELLARVINRTATRILVRTEQASAQYEFTASGYHPDFSLDPLVMRLAEHD